MGRYSNEVLERTYSLKGYRARKRIGVKTIAKILLYTVLAIVALIIIIFMLL